MLSNRHLNAYHFSNGSTNREVNNSKTGKGLVHKVRAYTVLGTSFLQSLSSHQNGNNEMQINYTVVTNLKKTSGRLFGLLHGEVHLRSCAQQESLRISMAEKGHSPRRYPYLYVAVGVEWSNGPESYGGGSVATGKAFHAGQVKGDAQDKERCPPGWGLGWGYPTS